VGSLFVMLTSARWLTLPCWRYIVRIPLRPIAIAGFSLICALLATGPVFADAAPPTTPTEPGVWQKHQYSFAFLGFTTTYSCDGLAGKLKVLLIAAGARSDAKARSGACASGFGRPDKFARADLTFYTLTPVSTNAPADGPAVDGTWRAVAFAARSPRELATGDCELVEQFKSNVLSMFTTRNVQSATTCVPHQESGSAINLKFESFSGVARKQDHPQTAASPTT
jgi:hypothetical protein